MFISRVIRWQNKFPIKRMLKMSGVCVIGNGLNSCELVPSRLKEVLYELNIEDKKKLLNFKRKTIEKNISTIVAENVDNIEMADDLIFIATLYGKNKNLGIEDIVKLRSYVKSMLTYYTYLHPSVYSYLLEILKHHKAIPLQE